MKKRRVKSSIFGKTIAYLVAFILIISSFSFGVIAPSHPVITDDSGNTIEDSFISDVDTIIICNNGHESSIDAAIARAIAEDMGLPIIYTEHDKIDPELLNEFKDDGVYRDVENIVIVGGDSVVSDNVQDDLDSFGAVLGGFDTVRIEGTTATGTAVEAIEYFYGPELVSEVTLVSYEGDDNHEYDQILHEAANLGHPIIPISSDVEGLPADVAKSLETVGVDNVNIIGSFDNEADVKTDLGEVEVVVETEVKADNIEELEDKLEQEVINNLEPGEKIDVVLVEEGSLPPVISGDEIVFYYQDEDNDGKDDGSGTSLADFSSALVDKASAEGATIDSFKVEGDNTASLEETEGKLENQGINVETGSFDDLREIDADVAKKVSEDFKDAENRFDDLRKEHQAEFEAALPTMLAEFKAYYTEKKESGELSQKSLELGAQLLDEANKNDAPSTWQLMQAFANEEHHEEYVNSCAQDSDCIREQVEFEKIDIEESLERLIGTDRAREVSNLDVGEKVGLLGLTEFIPPGKEEEFRTKINDIMAGGAKPEELVGKYTEKSIDDAHKIFGDNYKRELEALGKADEFAKLTPEQIKVKFDERLELEGKAYLAGVIKGEQIIDPAQRAAIFAQFEGAAKELEGKGIERHTYLTPDDWKNVYEKYSKEGKLSDDDIKRYEASTTAYQAWEEKNPGFHEDPKGTFYDSKTGQFSFSTPEGVITGIYNSQSGKCNYNDEGKLIEGYKDGRVLEYTPNNLPTGFKYDDKTGTYSDGKATYTPESHFNAFTGTYDFQHPSQEYPEGYVIQCGNQGCSGGIYTGIGSDFDPAKEGWSKSEDGKTWVAPDGQSYSTTPYSSSGTSHTDAFGNSWTQSSDGNWASSSGEVHTGDAYHYTAPSGSTGATSGGGTYAGSTSTGTYSGYTGTETYSGGVTTSGGTTTSSDGHTAPSGGDSGGYSAPSGGDSGGGSAPSGGGDGGGGGTGHVISGYSIGELQSGGKGLLLKWLWRS